MSQTSSLQHPVTASGLTKFVDTGEGRLEILTHVDLAVANSEAVAILGASGSGKSTLLGLLAGLDDASGGEACLFGTPLQSLDEDGRAALRAGKVGFVFQSFQLLSGMTALENAMLPLELSNHPSPETAAIEALSQAGLGERLHHYPSQLSGGEQQRVALARAFAPGPQVLFADEPTANLDPQTGERVAELLFDLQAKSGTVLILVTHDEALARRCDRRLHLRDGRLEAEV